MRARGEPDCDDMNYATPLLKIDDKTFIYL